MKSKKELTPTQQKKRYSRLRKTCYAGEFLTAIAPFVTIGAVNYNEYFVEYNGTKMSIACIMAMAIMGIALWAITKKKLENSFATLLIGWAAVAFIFQMMGSIVNDIATIMWFGLIGLTSSAGLDVASKKLKTKEDKITEGIEQAKRDMTANAYKAEVNKDGRK